MAEEAAFSGQHGGGGTQEGVSIGHGTQDVFGQVCAGTAQLPHGIGALVKDAEGLGGAGVTVAGSNQVVGGANAEACAVSAALDPHLCPQVLEGEQIGKHIHLAVKVSIEGLDICALGGVAYSGGNADALPLLFAQGEACRFGSGSSLREGGKEGVRQCLTAAGQADGEPLLAEKLFAQGFHPGQQCLNFCRGLLGAFRCPADVLTAAQLLPGNSCAGLLSSHPHSGVAVTAGDEPLLVGCLLPPQIFQHGIGIPEAGGGENFQQQSRCLLPDRIQAHAADGDHHAMMQLIHVENLRTDGVVAQNLPGQVLQLGGGVGFGVR